MRFLCLIVISGLFQQAVSSSCGALLNAFSKCKDEQMITCRSSTITEILLGMGNSICSDQLICSGSGDGVCDPSNEEKYNNWIGFKASGIDGNTTDLIFHNVDYNYGDGYNSTTGVFTAPISGAYIITLITSPVYIKRTERMEPEEQSIINQISTCIFSVRNEMHAENYQYVVQLDRDNVVTLPIALKEGDGLSVRNCSRDNYNAVLRGYLTPYIR